MTPACRECGSWRFEWEEARMRIECCDCDAPFVSDRQQAAREAAATQEPSSTR